MKYGVIWTFIFIISSFKVTADDSTKNYLRIDYGIGNFKTDKFETYKASPVGKTFGAAFGTRFDFLELGIFYRNMNLESKIISDSVNNKILHTGSSLGLDMSIFLNRRFSLKVGYALNNYKEKLASDVSSTSLNAIKTTYGLEESHSSSKVFYGGSVDFFDNPQYDLYFSVVHFPTSNGGSYTTAQIGFRIYVKSVLESFFSHK